MKWSIKKFAVYLYEKRCPVEEPIFQSRGQKKKGRVAVKYSRSSSPGAIV